MARYECRSNEARVGDVVTFQGTSEELTVTVVSESSAAVMVGRNRWMRADCCTLVRRAAPPDAERPTDPVERPQHYTAGAVECIDAIKSALTEEEFRGFCKGNVLKYAWREKHKGSTEDLRKASWYIGKLLEDAK